MLGVAPSTLSRRTDLVTQRAGAQELRVSPGTVIRLARLYRRRVVDEVGFALVAHATEHAPERVAAVENEIDRTLAVTGPPSSVAPEAFLQAAEAYLPPELYELVVNAVTGAGPSRGVVGEEPVEASAVSAAPRGRGRPGPGPRRRRTDARNRERVPA
jgi:hypothetical protein